MLNILIYYYVQGTVINIVFFMFMIIMNPIPEETSTETPC